MDFSRVPAMPTLLRPRTGALRPGLAPAPQCFEQPIMPFILLPVFRNFGVRVKSSAGILLQTRQNGPEACATLIPARLTLTLVGRCCRAAVRRGNGTPTEHHLIDAEV